MRSVAPHLSGDVRLNDMLLSSNPFWQRGTASLGAGHVVKFAWSEGAAAELDRERRVVLALAGTPFRRLPPIEATAERPLLIIARRVSGAPCAGVVLDDDAAAGAVARDLAEAFVALHHPAVLAAVTRTVVDLPAPTPQADTESIRRRLHAFVDPAHVPQIRAWCDWVDAVQADRAGADDVLLHGDVHGHNLLVEGGRLRCVLDYGEVSAGDHHYDFRYLPAIERTVFFCRAAEEYERRAGRAIEPARVLAWHIRTVLGDALWRSEAGVALPGGGTVDEWIALLQNRIVELAAWRPFDAPSLH